MLTDICMWMVSKTYKVDFSVFPLVTFGKSDPIGKPSTLQLIDQDAFFEDLMIMSLATVGVLDLGLTVV